MLSHLVVSPPNWTLQLLHIEVSQYPWSQSLLLSQSGVQILSFLKVLLTSPAKSPTQTTISSQLGSSYSTDGSAIASTCKGRAGGWDWAGKSGI